MDNSDYNDTIVAIATPPGEGGIGIVRLSGPDSIRIADEIFASKNGGRISAYPTYTIHYGHVVERTCGNSSERDKIIDEVIVSVMKAPKTYTKEDVVEINCHGGGEAMREVLRVVISKGARIAQPGEFTRRAFMNGRIDLTQAEAVLDMIRAKTEGAFRAAVRQLEGGLSRRLNDINSVITDITAHVEASIDFSEEDIDIDYTSLAKKADMAISELSDLIESSKNGIILRDGLLAVICGKPNVGKSSLMNLLLKRDRVIVTPIPGTTRDAIEEMISLDNIPIKLVDTAGISETDDSIEKEGISRSKKYIENADLVLFVLDGSEPVDIKDKQIMEMLTKKKKLVIINKSDIERRIDLPGVRKLSGNAEIVEISVKKKTGIDLMEKAIVDMVWSAGVNQAESAMVTNARHKKLLENALDRMLSAGELIKQGTTPELIAVELKEAIYSIGLITGVSISDDILDRIFAEFCIGK